MNDCIFCKIVANDLPCAKIWEDDNFMAFLDIRPFTKGMTLVIPKEHKDSDIFNNDPELVKEIFKAAKIVSDVLKKAFDLKRIAVVSEGVGVGHLHLKLYPLHGYVENADFPEPKEKIYFEKYQGYVSTQMGPQSNPEELNKLAEFIREKNKS